MRTAIRTTPYDSNKYPKFLHLPQRLKVWLRGDKTDCEELQYFKDYQLAGSIEYFYHYEVNDGSWPHFSQSFPWDRPLEALGSDAVLVFYNIRRDSIGMICNLDCTVVKREDFEKEYVISKENTSDVNLSNDLIALNKKIKAYFHDKDDRKIALLTIRLIIKLGGKITFHTENLEENKK